MCGYRDAGRGCILDTGPELWAVLKMQIAARHMRGEFSDLNKGK